MTDEQIGIAIEALRYSKRNVNSGLDSFEGKKETVNKLNATIAALVLLKTNN